MADKQTTGSLDEWRDGDDEFNILVTKLSVALILNRKLCDALREIRRDIEESADDVVWMRGGIETVCDRITAVLGDQDERE